MFGEEMKKEFALDVSNNIVFCNHGSYGAVPKRVLQKRFDLLAECEAFPDEWFRKKAFFKYEANLKRAAEFVGSHPKNLVFVPNPTTAINSVLASMEFTQDDVILTTTHTYNAIKLAVEFSSSRKRAQVHQIEIPLQLTSENQLVDLFVRACETVPNIKLAIIDHISSASAILFPVKKIIDALKPFQILILIDGAHAPGQVPELSLDDLGADFYTGTLHKWTYATKGAAILWVDPRHQSWVKPLVKSHNYNKGFQAEFFQQGTGDLTRYLCVEEALDFYQSIGGQPAIANHAKELLDFAENLFTQSFQVEPAPIDESLRAPYMRVIKMPSTQLLPEETFLGIEELMVTLVEEFKIVTALTFFNGRTWIRFSANIYNSREDYVKLRDRLAKALKIDIHQPSPR